MFYCINKICLVSKYFRGKILKNVQCTYPVKYFKANIPTSKLLFLYLPRIQHHKMFLPQTWVVPPNCSGTQMLKPAFPQFE